VTTNDSRRGLKKRKVDRRLCKNPRKLGARGTSLTTQCGTFEATNVRDTGPSYLYAMTISMLPDDVLLETFIFCLRRPHEAPFSRTSAWHGLVHVCRRWRQIIFSSPRRLNLQLLCTHGTPVRKNLDCWPAFPIVIDYHVYWNPGRGKSFLPDEEDNVIAVLEHPDRVRCVKLAVPSSLLTKVASVMREPFPVLTLLRLSSEDGSVSTLPSTFLGGSAPCLQEIYLEGIPFPALPRLLSSASDLVNLQLHNIPPDGYISPAAMVTGLTALTRLKTLSIRFQSSNFRFNNSDRTPPLARIILPSLTLFGFRGNSEYLEDLVAQIDAPRLVFSRITYFNQLIFDVPQLSRFIGRAENLGRAPFRHAQVGLGGGKVYISFVCEQGAPLKSYLFLQISCQGLDWQVSSMAQILSQSSLILSHVAHLSIHAHCLRPGWKNIMVHTDWLDLLRPFIVVETLLVSRQLAGHVALAFQQITGETVAEVLPALHLLCLEGQLDASVCKFTAVSRHFSRTVTIASTLSDFLKIRGSRLGR
jgi:hypothetical protein